MIEVPKETLANRYARIAEEAQRRALEDQENAGELRRMNDAKRACMYAAADVEYLIIPQLEEIALQGGRRYVFETARMQTLVGTTTFDEVYVDHMLQQLRDRGLEANPNTYKDWNWTGNTVKDYGRSLPISIEISW